MENSKLFAITKLLSLLGTAILSSSVVVQADRSKIELPAAFLGSFAGELTLQEIKVSDLGDNESKHLCPNSLDQVMGTQTLIPVSALKISKSGLTHHDSQGNVVPDVNSSFNGKAYFTHEVPSLRSKKVKELSLYIPSDEYVVDIPVPAELNVSCYRTDYATVRIDHAGRGKLQLRFHRTFSCDDNANPTASSYCGEEVFVGILKKPVRK